MAISKIKLGNEINDMAALARVVSRLNELIDAFNDQQEVCEQCRQAVVELTAAEDED